MYRTVIELVGNGKERELGEKELKKGILQSEVGGKDSRWWTGRRFTRRGWE